MDTNVYYAVTIFVMLYLGNIVILMSPRIQVVALVSSRAALVTSLVCGFWGRSVRSTDISVCILRIWTTGRP